MFYTVKALKAVSFELKSIFQFEKSIRHKNSPDPLLDPGYITAFGKLAFDTIGGERTEEVV